MVSTSDDLMGRKANEFSFRCMGFEELSRQYPGRDPEGYEA